MTTSSDRQRRLGGLLVSEAIEVAPHTVIRPKAAQRETLNFRVKAEDRNLNDRAAQLLGKSRTDFMLKSARRAAPRKTPCSIRPWSR